MHVFTSRLEKQYVYIVGENLDIPYELQLVRQYFLFAAFCKGPEILYLCLDFQD